jgi:hypothetical protein
MIRVPLAAVEPTGLPSGDANDLCRHEAPTDIAPGENTQVVIPRDEPPGSPNRVQPLGKRGRIEDPEAYNSVAVREPREQGRDIGSKMVVGRVTDRHAIHPDQQRRAIERDELRNLCQRRTGRASNLTAGFARSDCPVS